MKELKTHIITLCDYAVISRDGKLSINGIFEELRAVNFPTGLARAFLVTTVEGAPSSTYSLQVKMESDNKSIKTDGILKPINLNVQTGPNGKTNLVLELVNVGFPEEGEYLFKVYNQEKHLSTATLKVMQQDKDTKPNFLRPN